MFGIFDHFGSDHFYAIDAYKVIAFSARETKVSYLMCLTVSYTILYITKLFQFNRPIRTQIAKTLGFKQTHIDPQVQRQNPFDETRPVFD